MEADTVHGLAEWRTHEVSVAHCVFGGAGLRLTDSPRGTVAFNRMDRCEIGLDTRDAALTIEGNVLSGCTTGMYLSGSSANVLRNDVRQCGTGIRVESIIDLNLVGNTIVGIQGHGIDCWEVVYLFADSNIVGQCVGDGMRSDSPYSYDSASIRRNTIFGNAGSGIVLLGQTVHAVVLENNIVSGNNGWGLSIGPGVGVTTRCNDWFGNGLGGVDGGTAGPSDLSMDPLFCGADSADVRLDSGSPLVDASGCGQIGALGVGCGKTATVLQMVAVVPHGRGVAVRWRFGFTAPALTWLERATGQTGPWRPVSGQPEADGETYTQVDEDAEPGISYWYRVGWQEGAGQEVGYSTPVRYTIVARQHSFSVRRHPDSRTLLPMRT